MTAAETSNGESTLSAGTTTNGTSSSSSSSSTTTTTNGHHHTTSSTSSSSADDDDDVDRDTILVTGGCGYIGSHTIVELLEQNYNVVVVDNLSNSSAISLDRVCTIVGLSSNERNERLLFYNIDICNEKELRIVFEDHKNKNSNNSNRRPFHSCIHFAGLKAVGESTRIPLRYYENNLIGTFVLLKLMDEYNCHSIVFSSSATVYGAVTTMPITEQTHVGGTGITNAYGRTKYMIEEILKDFYHSKKQKQTKTTTTKTTTKTTTSSSNNNNNNKNDNTASNNSSWYVVILRYFNPVGAHSSGMIGEDPNGIPNNLMPYVSQVAIGRREYITIFGTDYPTKDGTGVRDYIHVMDLAQGHICAIQYIQKKQQQQKHIQQQHIQEETSNVAADDGADGGGGFYTFNLGTGIGYSVYDMINAMSIACGHDIPYKIGERRTGDIAICYADATFAEKEMNWRATRTLHEMCQDLWNWQSKNPNGFQ